MKDIGDYFLSPKKSNENAAKETAKNVENNVAIIGKKLGRKKKKRRKPTDPEVRVIADMLSNKLAIISPNSNSADTNDSSSSGQTLDSNSVDDKSSQSNLGISDQNSRETLGESPVLTPKVNAFQFLMDSRNKVIGSNSEGLPLNVLEETNNEDKDKLKARKNLFEKWADNLGASKRKRDDEEVEKHINKKLEKRAKRLKKLLHSDSPSEKVVLKNKGVKKISSSESDNSTDVTNKNTAIVQEKEVQDISVPSSSPKKNGNLLNFLDVLGKDENKPCMNISKRIIKIKMFSPSTQSSSPRLADSDLSKDGIDMKRTPSKKSKKKRKIVDELAPDSQNAKLDNSLDDFSTSEKAYANKKEKKMNDASNTATLEVNDLNSQIQTEKGQGRSLRNGKKVNYNEIIKSKIVKGESKLKTPSKKLKHNDSVEKIDLLAESEEEIADTPKVALKVAPVFKKSTPKPKVTMEVIEARKKFLMSGVPDSLKKRVEKKKRIEERGYDVFPTISHVQQTDAAALWFTQKPDLSVKDLSPLKYESGSLTCSNLTDKSSLCKANFISKTEKLKSVKACLDNIKLQSPGYPVNKVFRQISEKSYQVPIKSKKSSPKREKKKDPESTEPNSISKEHEMWTEKYKPRTSHEIIGNNNGVNELKKWLTMWKSYSQEINSKKVKFIGNSESEFESTDCDSRDSTWLPGNTILLYGPCGSGKTSALYALAEELKFKVLELNASTRRTGKILLQELQEATQSHQVRKSESLSQFMKKTSTKVKQTKEKTESKKMCILLLEDIDIIFEQDEGFLSSLMQLILTSKRPIVLTTSDKSPPHVQKFVNQYECIDFSPLSAHCLATWLQTVCLVEGLLVDKDHLGNLLEYHRGDIRKTLMHVQFWCQSGGQLDISRELPLKIVRSITESLSIADEKEGTIEERVEQNESVFTHKNCLGSFEVFGLHEQYAIPLNINLGLLWWNLPNLLDTLSYAPVRYTRKSNGSSSLTDSDPKTLRSLLSVYESLSLADNLYRNYYDPEPDFKKHGTMKDSQELSERVQDLDGNAVDLTRELTHVLLNGSIKSFTQVNGSQGSVNMALPCLNESKWRAEQIQCERFLESPVPLSNVLDRRSTCLDYFPALRFIARIEDKRASVNTKRGNRFRHYMKELNMSFNSNSCKLACKVLNTYTD